MLDVSLSPSDKRKALRAGLKSGRIQRCFGAFSPLVGRELERHGFEGVYVSGAVLSADLGLPDIGLTSLTEVAQRGGQIARATNLPAVIDVDTGFGEPMNCARTIRVMEEAGLAACHIEDQLQPKRCGHLDHKEVVDTATMQRRLRAAVEARRDPDFLIIARTDARGVEGMDGAIARAKAYVEAGADMIFPEAMADAGEFEAMRAALDVPLLANMTEFGKSELLTTSHLQALGIEMVIHPVTGLRLAMGAVQRALATIEREGSQERLIGEMQTRADLYELVGYGDYARFDESVFNFAIPGETGQK